jgi:hypothetical protein
MQLVQVCLTYTTIDFPYGFCRKPKNMDAATRPLLYQIVADFVKKKYDVASLPGSNDILGEDF